MGKGKDYLIHSLFSDYIFSLGRDCGEESVWMGTWRWEKFFWGSHNSHNYIFHIGMKALARAVNICFVVYFQTTYFCCGGSIGIGEWRQKCGFCYGLFSNTLFLFCKDSWLQCVFVHNMIPHLLWLPCSQETL